MSDYSNTMTPAQIVGHFLKYLSDEVTAFDSQHILNVVLRTSGKVYFTPAQVAKICHRWAMASFQASGLPIFESLCTALLRIYQADAFCPNSNFCLADFIKPFISELFALCPADEREIFKEELPNVKKKFQRSMEVDKDKQMAEFEVEFAVDGETKMTEGEWLRLTGERFQEHLVQLAAIAKDASLSLESREKKVKVLMGEVRQNFQNIINDTILKERLSGLIAIGKQFFNREEIATANCILSFISDIVDVRKDQFLERELTSALTLDQFDAQIVQRFLDDPALKPQLKPLLSNIFETRPTSLVSRLVQEEDAQKRKQLLRLITVFEPEIFYVILKELRSQTYSKWFFIRNLLFLLTKISRPADIPLQEVLNTFLRFITPGTYPALVKESVSDYLFFDAVSGANLFLNLITAENIQDVLPGQTEATPQDIEHFRDAVAEGVGMFNLGDCQEAVHLFLEAIRSELSHQGHSRLARGGAAHAKLVQNLVGCLASTQSALAKSALAEFAGQTSHPAVRNAIQTTLASMSKPHQSFL